MLQAPDPSTVRPPPVLRLAVDQLKEKWVSGCSYRYACDQMKAIRQDLTVSRLLSVRVPLAHTVLARQVQGIRNRFTTEVYELHARMALMRVFPPPLRPHSAHRSHACTLFALAFVQGDSNEFNQCQTQLIALHNTPDMCDADTRAEFVAYRVLYYMFNGAVTDSERLLLSLPEDVLAHPAVQHAVLVRSAVNTGNHARFFKLYRSAPNMGRSVMDFVLHDLRIAAVTALCKSLVSPPPPVCPSLTGPLSI